MSRDMKSESSSSSVESGSDDDEVESENLISSTSSNTDDDDQTPYEKITENVYHTDKKKKVNKEIRKMQCECGIQPDEPDFVGCGDDCLNRLLKIECGSKCKCGEFCTNKAFQRGYKQKLEVIKTARKGWGLKTLQDIQKNQFVIEYCGEVVDLKTFQKRAGSYAKSKQRHYYFMTLNADEIIDATKRGNCSRFINHSCEPNCVTEKWTVRGYLRIGFFALHAIPAGTELTFDYQFQRYGKKAQRCFCGSTNCRGIIGGDKRTPLKRLAPKKRKRRNITSDLADLTVAEELERLVGEDKCLCNSDKALQLSQLMVRAENLSDRMEFLKVIQKTTNSAALKAFVKYQGLSLLWSWMVDMGETSNKLSRQLLLTLKHLPISNLNQLKDSKIIRAVAKLTDLSPAHGKSEEEASSSSASPIDIERQDSELSQEGDREQKVEVKKEVKNEDISVIESKEKRVFTLDDNAPDKSSDEEGEISDQDEGDIMPVDEMSEDGKSETEDDISRLAEELLSSWSNLKEVYRIPKKVGTPDKRDQEPSTSTAGMTSAPGTPVDEEIKNIKWKTASPLALDKESTSSGKDTPDTPRSGGSNPPPPLMSIDIPGIKPLESADDSLSGMDESPTDGFTKVKSPEIVEKPETMDIPNDIEQKSPVTQRIMQLASSTGNFKLSNPTQTSEFGSGMRHAMPGMFENQFRPRHPGVNPAWRGRKFRPNMPRFPDQYGQNIEVIGGVNNPHFGHKMQGPPSQQWQGQGQFGLQDQAGSHPGMGPNAPIQSIPGTSHIPPNHYQNQKNWSEQFGQQQSQSFIPPFNNSQPPPKQQFPMYPQFPPNFPPPPMGTPNYPPPPLPQQSQQQNFSNQSSSIMLPQVLQNILNSTNQQKMPNAGNTQNIPVSAPQATQSPIPPPAPKSRSPKKIPSDWKTATDPNGKVYYYHTVTRITQWEPPTPEDAPSPTDLSDTSSKTPESSPKQTILPHERKKPSTPPGTPPISPIERYTTAPADTTGFRGADIYAPGQSLVNNNETRKIKIRETFRTKLSAVVVNCLNPYHKIDCKDGRITTVDDFKYLARKLTHGIMQKELGRVTTDDELVCNDSVKIKTKEYIRQYMHKFGSVYKRS